MLLDVWLPDGKGIDYLPRIRQLDPELPVIVITANHEMGLAIQAMKLGASDYLTKPVSLDDLQRAIDRALLERASYRQRQVIQLSDGAFSADKLVGKSPAMVELEKTLGRLAATRTTVLVTGESGTGKELVARVLHRYSECAGPFVAINCAAVVSTLMESELFGHEKGAFTGATSSKAGKLELAGDGTVFLDEMGELPLELQAKLLRVIQEREFERVGGLSSLPLRARVIAATNRDLYHEVTRGHFREDLYHRISVVTVHLPPLRERPEDIPMLVEHLLSKTNRHLDANIRGVDEKVMALLQTYAWPGNVRELENTLIRACLRAGASRVLLPTHFSGLLQEMAAGHGVVRGAQPTVGGAGVAMSDAGVGAGQALAGVGFDDDDASDAGLDGALDGGDDDGGDASDAAVRGTLAAAEKEAIERALRLANGHKGRACAMLKISRPTMDRKIRKYGINVAALRASMSARV